jgi:hypothetical protein
MSLNEMELRILHLIAIKNAITARANMELDRGGWLCDHYQTQCEIDYEISTLFEKLKRE